MLAETLVAQNISFGIIATVMVVGAIRVVTSKNVVHAALWLVCVLAGAAAQYLLVYAEFVAITQILVYVGAVMVLFLFGVMLTRARIGNENDLNNKNWALGIPVALTMFAAMAIASTAVRIDTQAVSDAIFKPYLLPFWALSFVLLVAVIGAIVLARKD
ncbi:MAG: NADH-quinone oxidoreductase subunit J [Actinobacteria bacterium]|nr:NADH-quinone oxidoreductase subunit J [Actinomycetota bacterium]